MRFQNEWASLIVVSIFTVFALLDFVFEGNFPSTSSRGLIFGGVIYRRVFCVAALGGGGGGVYLEGLIHGGAYFRNFTVLVIVAILAAPAVKYSWTQNSMCPGPR